MSYYIYFTGFVVQGSNGEYPYLTTDERVDMVQKVSKMASSDKLIIAGAGCECKSAFNFQNFLRSFCFADKFINPRKRVAALGFVYLYFCVSVCPHAYLRNSWTD